MAKTKETKLLEQALDEQCRRKREYGCEEVTIGFSAQGLGNEIVDFMSMDAQRTFRCYEIKVSLADLKTDNKKSFYGHYNYLVVSESLYLRNPVWANYIPPYTGILVGKDLTVRRQAKRREIDEETSRMLEDSLLRSVFWKYETYKDAKDRDALRNVQKQLKEYELQMEQIRRENDRINWTYQDYEHYYRLNHQDPTWSLETDGKTQRKQYALRTEDAFTWIHQDDGYVCPQCQYVSEHDSSYCPHCGSDLRKIKVEK